METIRYLIENKKLITNHNLKLHVCDWMELDQNGGDVMGRVNISIEKGAVAQQEIDDEVKRIKSLENRVLHKFKSLNELNAFRGTHDCGRMWADDDGVSWNIYEYK